MWCFVYLLFSTRWFIFSLLVLFGNMEIPRFINFKREQNDTYKLLYMQLSYLEAKMKSGIIEPDLFNSSKLRVLITHSRKAEHTQIHIILKKIWQIIIYPNKYTGITNSNYCLFTLRFGWTFAQIFQKSNGSFMFLLFFFLFLFVVSVTSWYCSL